MVKITYINTIESINSWDCCKDFNFNMNNIYYINTSHYFRNLTEKIQKDYLFSCDKFGYIKIYPYAYKRKDYFGYFMDLC
jgi:hypothetical protein